MTRKRIRYNDRAEKGNAAWDGDRLVGLVRLLDDSEYIEIVPEESKNAAFCLRITAFRKFSQWFPPHFPDALLPDGTARLQN